ncbi:unnamed protein product [Plutella xylostella]|uniref:(diamondback moth) hypothetical protein n=1 Tax=Plutella xylostella TaxID=51655 RepID=A0A8S4G985_PLUXY|nr:unnamed protein product [Plutella xylostella]
MEVDEEVGGGNPPPPQDIPDADEGKDICLDNSKPTEGENIEAIKKFIEEQEKEILELQAEVKPSTSKMSEQESELNESFDLDASKYNEKEAVLSLNKDMTMGSVEETAMVASDVMNIILSESEAKLAKKNLGQKSPKAGNSSSEKVNSGSMALSVGSRVEAKDFSELWYPAHIAEVDYDEMEVLVHYDNIANKHDEWINVSSPRLRPFESGRVAPAPAAGAAGNPVTVKEEPKVEERAKATTFAVGDRCLARWRDNRRFMATVHAELENGKYEVVFDDGVHWTCGISRLSKMREAPGTLHVDTGGAASPAAPSPDPAAAPTPPYHTHLFDPARDYLGSKSERRERKRKLNIKEIFNIGQKKKKVEGIEKPQRKRAVVKKKVAPAVVPLVVKTEVKTELPDAVAAIIGTVQPEAEQLDAVKPKAEKPDIAAPETVAPGPEVSEHTLEVTVVDPNAVDDNTEDDDTMEGVKLEIKEELLEAIKTEELEEEPGPSISDDVMENISRTITKLEDDLVKVSSPKRERSEGGGEREKKKSAKKSKLRLKHEIKVKEEVQKVKSELETMKSELEQIKKRASLSLLKGDKKRAPEELAAPAPGEWCCKWVNGQPVGAVSELDGDDGKGGLPRRSVQRSCNEGQAAPGEWCCKWVNGQPVGAVSELDGDDGKGGLPRRSVQRSCNEGQAAPGEWCCKWVNGQPVGAVSELDGDDGKGGLPRRSVQRSCNEGQAAPGEWCCKWVNGQPVGAVSELDGDDGKGGLPRRSVQRSCNEGQAAPGEWCCKWVNGQPVGAVSELDGDDSKGGLPRRSVQSYGRVKEGQAAPGEWCCKWVNGQPVGAVSELDGDDGKGGLPRRSVQVEDTRLPEGWTKHMVRRSLGSSAGKWDVVLVNPDNKRLHTKTDMVKYLETINDPNLKPYEAALLDFGMHRKLAKRLGWDTTEPEPTSSPPYATVSHSSPIIPSRKMSLKKKVEKMQKFAKKKKRAQAIAYRQTLAAMAANVCKTAEAYEVPPLEDGYVYVGSLKVQIIENLLRCPAEGCFKNFRNNTLIKMHIKHYHRELRKELGATPKVSDLASSRAEVEVEPPRMRFEPELKVPKLKISKKRLEEVHVEPVETVAEAPPEEIVTTPPVSLEPETPKILDSPKLRNALVSKVIKRPRVLLPVKKSEDLFPDMEGVEPVKEPERDLKLEMDPVVAIQTEPAEALDFESEISSYTVSKLPGGTDRRKKGEKKKKTFASIAKAKSSEEEEWCANSDVETRLSFPRSGSPDSKFFDKSLGTPQPQSSESTEDKGQHLYMYNEAGERIRIVHMKREEIINCHCGFREEDGLMIQCELCLCWQHALCHNIQKEAEVPEKYTCSICLNPRRGRRSQRFLHDQDRLYEGLLPGARPCETLKRSHELSGNLLRIEDALHALKVKYHVAT